MFIFMFHTETMQILHFPTFALMPCFYVVPDGFFYCCFRLIRFILVLLQRTVLSLCIGQVLFFVTPLLVGVCSVPHFGLR